MARAGALDCLQLNGGNPKSLNSTQLNAQLVRLQDPSCATLDPPRTKVQTQNPPNTPLGFRVWVFGSRGKILETQRPQIRCIAIPEP